MAFTFGSKAQINSSTANPITLALTTPANTHLLVVGIATQTTTHRTGGAPTYNGVAMTQVSTTQDGTGECTCELWYLANPSIGAYSISVPNAGGLTITVIGSCYVDAGATSAILDVYNQTSISVANPSLTVTTTDNGEAIVDMLGDGLPTAETDRSQTLLYATDESIWNTAAQYALQASAGAITFSHTLAIDDVAFVVAAFKRITITAKTSSDTGSGADAKVTGNPIATLVRAETGSGVETLLNRGLSVSDEGYCIIQDVLEG